MSSPDRVTSESALEIAASVGLDVERLRRDMEDPTIVEALNRNFELAQALQVTGTPSFVVGENVFVGALDAVTLRALVERARKK